eukprot:CAMPEP_0183373546 /NCGR_PEP_ID=MMETSP0164_2-20130417/111715_1 /TAXON_ID=221442 /ORGANISM="Coccolithus pelagicus ssp braarudi, Strain PLY182g" /LENGTH=108 /DNA_ID=CAMNT_0025550435 /DNA_START=56 /DNA_END=382 /DNA_ORIENTATION=+
MSKKAVCMMTTTDPKHSARSPHQLRTKKVRLPCDHYRGLLSYSSAFARGGDVACCANRSAKLRRFPRPRACPAAGARGAGSSSDVRATFGGKGLVSGSGFLSDELSAR